MSRPVFVRPEAGQDVKEILDYLKSRRSRAMRKFESNYKVILSLIQTMPYLFPKRWRTVRFAKVRGFKYVVYYMVRKHDIEIFAVVHGSRDTAAWKSRL